jgi:hypothetical protein
MPAASSGEQRDVGGGKEMAVADETQAHIASVVKHKRVPRAAMTGRPLKCRAAERRGAGRKGERLNARADGPGGEEHRGREQGIPNWTKGKHRREQAIAIDTVHPPRNTTDTQLLQAISREEKY